MIRTLAIAALIALTVQTAAFADEIALSESPAASASPVTGRIIGRYLHLAETYGLDLTQRDGVNPRDVVIIRRGQKVVGNGMVVWVGPSFSLITMQKGGRPLTGDEVSYVRHAVIPSQPVALSGETIIVRERSTACTAPLPSGGFASTVSFSSTASYTSTASYAPTTSYAPRTGYTSSTSFSPSTSYTGTASYTSTTGYTSRYSYSPSTSYSGTASYSSTASYRR